MESQKRHLSLDDVYNEEEVMGEVIHRRYTLAPRNPFTTGRLYYYNWDTDETSWEPADIAVVVPLLLLFLNEYENTLHIIFAQGEYLKEVLDGAGAGAGYSNYTTILQEQQEMLNGYKRIPNPEYPEQMDKIKKLLLPTMYKNSPRIKNINMKK